jgi:alcohol dehydrogenase
MPVPAVGNDDVLVHIHAAGVNPVDIKTRDGKNKVALPYRTPFILGNEVAGVVTQVGGRVRRFNFGLGLFEHADDLLFGEPGFLHEGDSCRAVGPVILYS